MSKSTSTGKEVIILGTREFGDRQIDCLIKVMRKFSSLDPQFMETMQFHEKVKRRIIAKTPSELRVNADDRPDFIDKHAEKIFDDWWIWTNWNGPQIVFLIRLCCSVADRKFGTDVKLRAEQWPEDANIDYRPGKSMEHLL